MFTTKLFIVVDNAKSNIAAISKKSQEDALSKVVPYLKNNYPWINEIEVDKWEYVNSADGREFIIYEKNDDDYVGFGFDMKLETHEV